MKTKHLMIFLVIGILSIQIYAEETSELIKPGITPDSWIYPVKRFFEGIDILLTFDELAKGEKYLHYGELRLSEAETMAEKGKPEFVNGLMEEYKGNIEKSNEISEKAQKAGKNVTRITELIALATSKHLDVLEDVYERVPEQAKPAIERAKTASITGHEKALNRLERIKPEMAAELHFRFAEKRLLKAEKMMKKGKLEGVDDIIKEYENHVNRSDEITEIAKGLGKNTTTVEQLVAEVTSKHLDVLTEVYEKVPEEAKPAIERAMNVSIKGHERAVKALMEKKERPEVAEEIGVEIPKPPEISGTKRFEKPNEQKQKER